jgi:hypothetical protein
MFGEGGKTHTNYFFKHNQLIYALRTNYIYNEHFYDSAFDDAKTITSKEELFFFNNKLIKWIDVRKIIVDNNSEIFAVIEKEEIAFVFKLQNKFSVIN